MRSWSAKTRVFLTVLVAAGLMTACGASRQQKTVTAPNFELKDLSGNTVRLESFRGHPVLLDFWATWCGPCRISIPMVEDFYNRHKADGLVVLGMNLDDEPQGVFGFVKHMGMTYPVLFAGNSTVPSDYQVDGVPYFVFIDPNGRIVQIYQGFAEGMARSWEDDLQTALKSGH